MHPLLSAGMQQPPHSCQSAAACKCSGWSQVQADTAPENHFGLHILPRALREDYRLMSYHYDRYWRVSSGLTSDELY